MGAMSWVFQRLTAILLLVVLGVHFWILHYQDPGTIVVYGNLAIRLKTAMFLSVDSILLGAGLFHAMNGLNNILLDYGVNSSIRSTMAVILTVLGLALFAVGIYSLFQFI
jgi:succinate dehydrogenase hydrophobic anchor subunit